MAHEIKVEWSGNYPCLCSGEWTLEIDGKDYSNCVPFKEENANTYGQYQSWHFEDWNEVFESYYDGLHECDWIEVNKEWLRLIALSEDEYHTLYEKFSECDFRSGSCGGCI